jgi:hypothetical protein
MTNSFVNLPTRLKCFFAIFDGRNGYALNAYPEERAGVSHFYGKRIVDEFATAVEAFKAAIARVQADCDARNAR